MLVLVAGVNHRTAPVEVRERFSFTEQKSKRALQHICADPAIGGGVLLFTCNRTEFYVTTRELKEGIYVLKDYLSRFSGVAQAEIAQYIYVYPLQDAIRHLFRVAAGLDSMLLGEPQILGQVRQAYQLASADGFIDKFLSALFQRAIAAGKKVRKVTKIDQNAVSISYAAVEMAKQKLGKLKGRSVLIIGAGKMSGLTARYLVANGATGIIVSNRSPAQAMVMAKQCGGKAVRFDCLYDCMMDVDIVISCTSAAHFVVHYRQLAEVMKRRPKEKESILMIDIAVPRDIDPRVKELPGIFLYNIDDLQAVVNHNLTWRRRIAAVAAEIIEEEVSKFLNWQAAQSVVPLITTLQSHAGLIKQKELARVLNQLDNLSAGDQKVVCALAETIVSKLLHATVTELKDYAMAAKDQLYAEVKRNLFS